MRGHSASGSYPRARHAPSAAAQPEPISCISAINGKHYDVAAALAIAGLGLTALMAAAMLGEVNAAARAAPGLTELQNRMVGRLRIDPIRMATFQARSQPDRQTAYGPSPLIKSRRSVHMKKGQ